MSEKKFHFKNFDIFILIVLADNLYFASTMNITVLTQQFLSRMPLYFLSDFFLRVRNIFIACMSHIIIFMRAVRARSLQFPVTSSIWQEANQPSRIHSIYTANFREGPFQSFHNHLYSHRIALHYKTYTQKTYVQNKTKIYNSYFRQKVESYSGHNIFYIYSFIRKNVFFLQRK